MTLNVRTALCAGLFALLLAGCSKPEDKLVGHYAGKINISEQGKAQMAKLGAAQAAQAQKMLDSMTMDLELKKDKTYSMNAKGPMGANNENGTWAVADQKVTLTPGAGSSGRPVTLTSDASGKVLTLDMGNVGGGGSMTFTKS